MACVRNQTGFGCYDNTTFLSCVCGSSGSQPPVYVPPDGGIGGGGGGMNIPTGVGNVGGWPGGSSGQLSQVLNSILAGIGLIQGAHYIPTPLQTGQLPQGASSQQPQPIIYQQPVGYNPNYNGNTGSKIEEWIKDNTGVVLIGGLLFTALMMKPPQRAR